MNSAGPMYILNTCRIRIDNLYVLSNEARKIELSCVYFEVKVMKTTPRMAEVLPSNKSLKSEMNYYGTTGQRGDNLQKLFLVLKNIAPTSIASEQAFSISANFIPKMRSLLSDQAIDDLCFEKGYFANEGYTYN